MERLLFHSAEVRASPVAGNGLFAKQSIDAGEEIVVESYPLIGVLDRSRLEDTCANCFRSATASGSQNQGVSRGDGIEVAEVNACTGCKKVKYCSKVRYSKFL